MREGTRNFMVGLASIGALGGMAFLLMSFGELDSVFNPRYKLTIKSDNAAGLRPGSGVEYSGVPVGVVDSIFTQADPDHPVRIVCLIDNEARIPKSVQPFAASQLIGGSARLQLQLPPGSSAASSDVFPADGSAEIDTNIRGGMLEQITQQLDQRMKPLMESLEKFNRLSDTFVAVGDNINDLMKPQTDADLAGGQQPNLRTAVAKVNAALDDAKEGLSLAKSFLGDQQMRDNAKAAVEKARQLIDQATAAVDHYAALAQSLKTDSHELTTRLVPVADTLAQTLNDVQRLTKAAVDGKGSLGLMLNNPDLYNSLTDASIRLERTLVQVQLLIEKFKQEGVQISF